ncbi:MAG: hypothetical protein ACLFVE_11225 [Chitinispirillaceae bacterium]
MRKGINSAVVSVACMGLGLLIYCINPADKDPLKWRSALEVPINHKLVFGEELPGLFPLDSTMRILNVDSTYYDDSSHLSEDTVVGNTVAFSVKQQDSLELVVSEENFGDKRISHKMGPIALSGIADVSQSIPLAGNFPSGPLAIPQQDIDVTDIYSIEFTDDSDPLSITVSNSSNVDLSDFEVDIAGFGSGQVADLAAGASADITIASAGNTLNVPLSVSVSASTESSGSFDAGSELQLSISLDGMTASEVDLENTVLEDLEKHFRVAYELSDTIEMKYVDFQGGRFFYRVENYTDIDFKGVGYHQHLWATLYCMENGIRSKDDLADVSPGEQDSITHFDGRIPAKRGDELEANANQNSIHFERAVNTSRLFTEWNDSLDKSVSYMDYHVYPDVSVKKRITISEDDSLVFSIESDGLQFREFYGVIREEIVRGNDTQHVPIDFPWPEQNKEKMRGKFIFEDVEARINVSPVLYQHTQIDTFVTQITMFDPQDPNTTAETTAEFVDVKNDTSYTRILDITNVTNRFPDSITVVSRSSLPVGTPMLVVNDLQSSDPEFYTHIGRTTIRTDAHYIMNASFDWAIADSFTMDLGTDTFAMFDQMRIVNKMDERRAEFNMYMWNNTNLYLRLYALVAPKDKMGELASLSIDDAYEMVTQEGDADDAGFVNLLGTGGVYLPKRSPADSVYNSVVLEEEQIEKIVSSDTCSWRWQIRFLQKEPHEALSDTDYVDIKSWFRVEGTNNSDSLMIW